MVKPRPLIWTQGLSDHDRDLVSVALDNAKPVLDRLRQVLRTRLDVITSEEISDEFLEGDSFQRFTKNTGRKAEIKQLLQILDF